uniref:Uncharacterized protein n=1 Tax=Romanomermis culicivorax TaxID=13658 RepID=A0A915IPV9_ROMCU
MQNILRQYTQCNGPPVKEVKSTKITIDQLIT